MNWIYSITQGNWPITKNLLKYAVNNKLKTKYVSKGDRLVFDGIGTGLIQGAFKVDSDWHDSTITWKDGNNWISEIDLVLLQTGYLSIKKSADSLAFVINKSSYTIYYRGSTIGPSNFGKPINDADFDIILTGLKNTPIHNIPSNSTGIDIRKLPDDISAINLEEKEHTIDPAKPRTIKFIINQIEYGKYAIPQFQRGYKWTRRQIEELWESIFEGFFVGSILTWMAPDQLSNIPVYGGPELDNPTELVLDGQQRITSIYYAISSPQKWSPNDHPTVFFVNIKALLTSTSDSSEIIFSETADNAKKKGMLECPYQFQQKIMPLTALKDGKFHTWVRSFADYLRDNEKIQNHTAYYENLISFFSHVWDGYQIPIVQLPKSLSLESVAEIFEKINSKGTRLGVFDLMNARFTKYGVNLRAMLDTQIQENENIRRMTDEISGAEKYLLQALCLYKTNSIKKSKILSLDREYMEYQQFNKNKFAYDWNNICKYTGNAIRDLQSQRNTGFGATNLSLLPYTVVVPILSALLYYINGNPTNALTWKNKIRNWYWAVVTSDHYSGSTNSNIEKDYREILLWFDDDSKIPEIVMEQRRKLSIMKLDSTKKNDSMYKAILCLISKEGARDFYTDEPPEYNELDIHHLFPKAGKTSYRGSVSVDSILNMTLLRSKTNRYISNKTPRTYVTSLIEKAGSKEVITKLFSTHLIPSEALDCMKNNDFLGFVTAREKYIRQMLQNLFDHPPYNTNDTVLYAK